MSTLVRIITAADNDTRNRSLERFAHSASVETLLQECAALDRMRRENDNLYERVRALLFLHAIHRFHLPGKPDFGATGVIPFGGYEELLNRRFEEAIETFLRRQSQAGPSEALSSGLASAYRQLGFQTLADQVRRSVRSLSGNQWMFGSATRATIPCAYFLRCAALSATVFSPCCERPRQCAWT